MARLKEKYDSQIRSELQKTLGLSNIMAVPRLEKIVLNIGLGEAIQDAKAIDAATSQLTDITGQKPVITKAKKSISNFKLRQGMSIGCKVTLRGKRMYEFFDRLTNAALPRIRDFKGVSARAFDGNGNYCLGIKEQIIFPEISYDSIDRIRGLGIVITTTASNDEQGKTLLKALGMPFRD